MNHNPEDSMNKEMDELIKGFFADRSQPPPATKELLHAQLQAAQTGTRQREVRYHWIIALFAVIFTAVLTFTAWVFMGLTLLFYLYAAFCLLSAISVVIISITCFNERKQRRLRLCCYL